MFFIHSMGRRNCNDEVESLEELGEIVTKRMASKTYDAITVAIGLTNQAVMPHVWIRRNDEDEWEGELGDSIKLGIEDGLLIEKDLIEMLNLNQAIARGIATVMDDGVGPVVTFHDSPLLKKSEPKKKKNEKDISAEAKQMIDNLFTSIREDDYDED